MNGAVSTLLTLAAFLVGSGAAIWLVGRLLRRWARGRRTERRVHIEDALKHLHHGEATDKPASLESLAGVLRISRNRAVGLIERLEELGLVRSADGGLRLTDEGRRDALRIVRVHRLLERYLAERTGVAEARWHEEADRREHLLTPRQIDALAAEMGDPRFDPHGSPIPTKAGDVGPTLGRPLVGLAPGTHAVIVSIEDEPEVVYAQLVAERLIVGTPLRVLESEPERIRVDAFGEEHVLAPLLAANVFVRTLAAAPPGPDTWEYLSGLAIGRSAKVVDISPVCRGPQRRRLLDLGLVPGTVVRAELASPGGDPTGYLVRGAVIALRRSQAELIRVEPMEYGAA